MSRLSGLGCGRSGGGGGDVGVAVHSMAVGVVCGLGGGCVLEVLDPLGSLPWVCEVGGHAGPWCKKFP